MNQDGNKAEKKDLSKEYHLLSQSLICGNG